ncbi:MAG TPA: tetratricopeptide repeat protein [Xanthomonadaceae bacterium]|jgi:tetratricopeptide (TPR) repeat protein
MERPFRNCWLWLGAIVLATALAFWPGTRGGFVFDDLPNMEPLGAYGAVDSLPALERYATSGEADPTGRPVAVLSFLLDAHDWPADPYPFKRTNILLHLLNGLLLFAALAELGRAFRLEETRSCRAAVLGAGLWMLHPLFVSTTLYIVQREAMLPATFTFLALWTWLVARRRLLDDQAGARRWMIAAVGLCTVLATLSKANGLLLPALLLVIECRLAKRQDSDRLRSARRWLLWLPTCVLFAYVLVSLPGFARAAIIHRQWTLPERLLTEPRVLFDYLGQLWFPRPFSPGLFNDGYVISKDLFHPWTTLPALAGVIAMAAIAWFLRDRVPSVAIAIAFYLAGQSIESGPFPLEIYFEHRNYLPAALMFWPLALWLTGPGGLSRLRTLLAFGLPMLLAAETWLGASLWGDPTSQALVWGERNPDSPRAQAWEAQYEVANGRLDRAEDRVRRALRQYPGDMQLLVNLAGLRCKAGSLSAGDLTALEQSFASAPDPTRLSFKWMERALPLMESGSCKGLGMAQADRLADAFVRNPHTAMQPGRRSDAEHLLGEIALAENRPQDALAAFNAAFRAEPKLDTVMVQSALLAAAHHPREALAHLQLASVKPVLPWYQWRSMSDVHTWVMYRQGFWQQQIEELRGKIVADLGNPS